MSCFSRDLCSIGGGQGGVTLHCYLCILIYVKLIWCSGLPEIYARLEEWGGSVCHGYMCILLCVKLLSVMVLQRHMLDWRRECNGVA